MYGIDKSTVTLSLYIQVEQVKQWTDSVRSLWHANNFLQL